MAIATGITTLLLLLYCGLLFYYKKGWRKLTEPVIKDNFLPVTRISIIVPARNEEDNLPALLNALSLQDYPSSLFEVIVIDDFSEDNTGRMTDSFGSNFYTLRLSEYVDGKINSYKKKALELGIHKCKGDLVVTTDADCWMGPYWLKNIANEYESTRTSMIVMPVRITTNSAFLSVFQALDFMSLQAVTGAAAGHNTFFMCNGANLAYAKDSFREVNGFNGIDDVASGDDMMLLHKLVRANKKISYLKSRDVIVATRPMLTVKDFLNQRIRWASKSARYQDKQLLPILIMIYGLNVLLLLLPFLSLVSGHASVYLLYWLLMILIKTASELNFLWAASSFFEQRKLLKWFPLSQPFHLLYTVIAGFFGSLGKYTWKGRIVK